MVEERLIAAVKVHRELYDTKDPDYMRAKIKNQIWSNIAQDVNIKDGDLAKTMWLKLRGSYRDARRRQRRSLKSGIEPHKLKPWRYQNQMSFLGPVMADREGNEDSDDYSEDPLVTLNSVFPDLLQSEEPEDVNSRGNKKRALSNDGDNSEGSADFSAPRTSNSAPSAYRKKSNPAKQDDLPGNATRPIQHHEEGDRLRETRPSESNADDPLYHFFISMYQLTKYMPHSFQHRVRMQLFQAVSQAEEDIMNNVLPTLKTSSSPYNLT